MSNQFLEALKTAEKLAIRKEEYQHQVKDWERKRGVYESEMEELKNGALASVSHYESLYARHKELAEEMQLLQEEEQEIIAEVKRYQEMRAEVQA